MPVIGAGVGIPGTAVGVGARIGFQTQAEKQADTATRISEQAEREREAETATRPTETRLDALARSDALARFRGDA